MAVAAVEHGQRAIAEDVVQAALAGVEQFGDFGLRQDFEPAFGGNEGIDDFIVHAGIPFKYAGNRVFRKYGWLFHQYTTTGRRTLRLCAAHKRCNRATRHSACARVYHKVKYFSCGKQFLLKCVPTGNSGKSGVPTRQLFSKHYFGRTRMSGAALHQAKKLPSRVQADPGPSQPRCGCCS